MKHSCKMLNIHWNNYKYFSAFEFMIHKGSNQDISDNNGHCNLCNFLSFDKSKCAVTCFMLMLQKVLLFSEVIILCLLFFIINCPVSKFYQWCIHKFSSLRNMNMCIAVFEQQTVEYIIHFMAQCKVVKHQILT